MRRDRSEVGRYARYSDSIQEQWNRIKAATDRQIAIDLIEALEHYMRVRDIGYTHRAVAGLVSKADTEKVLQILYLKERWQECLNQTVDFEVRFSIVQLRSWMKTYQVTAEEIGITEEMIDVLFTKTGG